MRIRLLLVGKVKERYLRAGVEEYVKRLGPFARVEFVQVADDPTPAAASAALELQVKQREGQRLLEALRAVEYAVALDRHGDMLSSEELAQCLQELALTGRSQVAFLIGGSLGLSEAVLARADRKLSFGPLTFPHQMVPLLVLEQVYRAMKINAGEPYHK